MWHHSLKDWELAPLSLYEFTLAESDKTFTDLLDHSEAITNRAYIILGFLVTGISVSAGYIVQVQQSEAGLSFIVWCAFISLLPLLACLFCIIRIIRSRNTPCHGTPPNEIMVPEYFECAGLTDEEKIKLLHRYAIEQNQEKIVLTKASNTKRIKWFGQAIWLLVGTLCLFIVCVLVNSLLSLCQCQ